MPATHHASSDTRAERGGVSIEWAGLLVVAALVVALVAASAASPRVGQAVASSVCRVLTLGQGGCGGPELSAEATLPTEPCTVGGEGFSLDGRIGVINAAGSRAGAVAVEQLSNGQFRVTVSAAADAGAEAGAGWEEWVPPDGGFSLGAFSGTTWGNDTGVPVDVMAVGSERRTFLVNSGEEADRVVQRSLFDAAASSATSSTSPLDVVGRYVVAPAVSWTGEWLGVPSQRDPTAITYLAGASTQASAWLSPALVGSADSTIAGEALLGLTHRPDGTATIHGEASSSGELSGGFVSLSGSWPPAGAVRIDATYGGTDLVSVSVGTDVTGSGTREERSWSLPIETTADQRAAQRLLLNPLPSAWDDYFERVADHGQATRVAYDTTGTTSVEAAASDRFLSRAGVTAGGTVLGEDVISAEYFDGSGWASWDACSSG